MSIHSTQNTEIALLEPFYHHARRNNGLIQFINDNAKNTPHNRKSQPSCSQNSLINLFDDVTWKRKDTKNGHANYQSKLIKGVHVGFKTHGQSCVDKSHLATIVENVSGLVNTMFDEVYEREVTLDEQECPDWKKSAQNYESRINKIQGNNAGACSSKKKNGDSNTKRIKNNEA